MLAGDDAGFAVGEALGPALAAAGVPAGLFASVPAGRKPRLLGLFNIFAARLLTIFASDIATETRAEFRISLR